MPTLKNTKWEAYSQHQSTGKAKGSDSVRFAKYKCKTNISAARCACRLSKVPAIIERIAELRKGVEADLRIEQVNVIEQLNLIAGASMGSFIDFDANKITYKSLSDVPEHLRSIIQEIVVKKTKHGDEIRLKLYSKTDALKMLGKNQQLFKEQVVLENPDGTNLVPPKIEVHFVKKKK